MRVLVLGGSAFLGRATADEALKAGHEVTTFNRGLSGPDVPGVEAVRGDRSRDDDLERLRGRTWDDGDYGALKVGCERAVRDAFGDRALIVRSGLLIGPYDNTGRLTWWLRRIAQGGQVLAPGDPGRPMSLIDARDQARWFLDRALRGLGGTFNVGGAGHNTTMGRLLGDCVEATGSDAELVWVDDDFLLERGVQPWNELPLWVPYTPEFAGVWAADSSAALRAGLTCRPVTASVRDMWDWLRERGDVSPMTHQGLPETGIDPDKERAVVDAWLAQK